MSVALPSERDEWWCPDVPCFSCSTEVVPSEPAVFWAGHQDLLLHRDCARELGVHLISGAREADLCNGTGSWGRRAIRAVRSVLVDAEWRT